MHVSLLPAAPACADRCAPNATLGQFDDRGCCATVGGDRREPQRAGQGDPA